MAQCLGFGGSPLQALAARWLALSLEALAEEYSDCPLLKRKMATLQQVSEFDLKPWRDGVFCPTVSFGNVEFGEEVVSAALLSHFRIFSAKDGIFWGFRQLPVVLQTDRGKLVLAKTWLSLRVQDHNLIGLSKVEVRRLLGEPTDIDTVATEREVWSFDSLELDLVLSEGVVDYAVVD